MSSNSRPAQVCDVMSHNVIQVNDNDSVEFVINLFDRCHISGAPVVDDGGNYVGVVTRTDLSGRKILDWVNNDCHLDSMLIRDIMSFPELISLPSSAQVTEAIHLMLSQKIHRVFITDANKKIIGVVSSFDVMKAIKVKETEGETEHSPKIPLSPQNQTSSAQEESSTAKEKTETDKNEQEENESLSEDESDGTASAKRLDKLEQRIQELIIRKQQDFQSMAAERSSTSSDN